MPSLKFSANLESPNYFVIKFNDSLPPNVRQLMESSAEGSFQRRLQQWRFPVSNRNINFLFLELKAVCKGTVDDALKEKKKLFDVKRSKKITNFAKDHKFKTKPYSYQKEAFNLALNSEKGMMLSMEMGTGKTHVAINVFDYLYQRDVVNHLLVVAPLDVLAVWQDQYEDHSNDFDSENPPAIMIGTKNKRESMLGSRIMTINYEGLRVLDDTLLKFARRKDVDLMVVFDESDSIKNPSAQQSRAAYRISMFAEFVLPLTGIPMTQNYLDLYNQFAVIDKNIFGFKSFASFKRHYAIYGGFGGYEIVGWKNLDELKTIVDANAFRVLKDDCLDLPPKIFQTRYIKMGKEQQKAYDQMSAECLIEMESQGVMQKSSLTIMLTQVLRLQQITAGFIKFDDGSIHELPSAKLDALEDIVKNIVVGQGKKLAVQCLFRYEMEMIAKMLTKHNVDFEELHGGIKSPVRRAAIKRFHDDDALKVLVCQIKVARHGIDLTPATFVARYSHTYSLRDTDQFEARFHRKGQENKVTYIDLVCDDTVDISVWNTLINKVDMASFVFKQGLTSVTRFLRGGKF